jgi:hypothetical protein
MFTLSRVVPWGRSYDEYRRMFALSQDDARGRLLGCADGPASFNAEGTARGMRIVSVDPLYRFDAPQIRRRIDATFDEMLDQTTKNRDEFVWGSIASVEELGRIRRAAMETFLADYGRGACAGRYVAAELPSLPFADGTFDIALSSHFLFLYASLGETFHVAATREIARVAREVRIFPLLALGGIPSPHLAVVANAMRGDGFTVTIDAVPYEFQRGGNQMMRIATTSHQLRP